MRVLICGSRGWNRPRLITDRMAKLPEGTFVLHGGARGADSDAAATAKALGLQQMEFQPDWAKYGKRAGIVRNNEMLNANPDLVLAFWDGRSTGTKHVIDEAENRGIKVEIYYEQGGSDWR